MSYEIYTKNSTILTDDLELVRYYEALGTADIIFVPTVVEEVK